MKKPTFISIVVAICMPIFLLAQTPQFNVKEFAPVGAKWEHIVWQVFSPEELHCTMEVVKDTIIQNKKCSVLKSNCLVSDNKTHIFYYIYSTSDKVFIYSQSTFNLLYDFSAKAGDSLKIWFPYNINCGKYNNFKVDSTRVLSDGKFNYRAYWVSSSDACVSWRYSSPIMERFGNLRFLFAYNRAHEQTTFLTKYSDKCVSLSFSPINCQPTPLPCNVNINYQPDCIKVATNEVESMNINVFPNPVSNIFTIQTNSSEINKVELIQLNGSILKSAIFTETLQIDVSDIPNGIYIIKLQGKKGVNYAKLSVFH